MQYPRLSSLRAAAEAAPLPAALTGLLALMLLVQLALPIEADLPAVDAGRPRVAALARLDVPPVGVYPDIAADPIFAPDGGGANSDDGAAGGAVTLLGVATSRGAAVAILAGSDGQAVTVRPGQSVGEWRLVGVGRGSALVDGPDGRRTLRVGEAAATSSGAASSAAEEPPVE